MEYKTEFTVCPNCGHYYNPSAHGSCPKCGGATVGATEIEPWSDAGIGKTEPAGSGDPWGGAGIGKTEPAVNNPWGGADGGVPGVTEPAVNARHGAGYTPFDEPTQIGGDIAVPGGTAPVVGWLVCIEGPMRGNDYRLHAGYNYIGRSTGDIRLAGDQQISRENHAMVAYDDADMLYYVGPSAGSNIIKVNNRPIFNAVELKSYDIISIGSTKLLFVALCGEKFDWKRG